MTPSKTYLKFQETRSKEDLDTLNGYLLRLQQISVILNGDTELSNEEENKLYDEDETLTDKVLRLLFGDTFFTFIAEYNLDEYDSWEDTVEDLVEDLWMTYWEYIHPKLPRTNMITSLIAGQEMTNTNISMTTTRKNTQSITKN